MELKFYDISLLIKTFANQHKFMTPSKYLIDYLNKKNDQRHAFEQIFNRIETPLIFQLEIHPNLQKKRNILELYIFNYT